MQKKIMNTVEKVMVALIIVVIVFAGAKIKKVGAAEGVYSGITVGDGDYSDWDSVTKYKGAYGVDRVAMVWDGYYLYLYFETFGRDDGSGQLSGSWNAVAWSGPNSSGNYSIKTEKTEMIVHLGVYNGNQPYVELNGKDGASQGAEVYVNNKDWFSDTHIWEVKIPTRVLPIYSDTLSLGFYRGETLIENVGNINMLEDFEHSGVKDELIFDGIYVDWKEYPHTTIDYSTNGTHSSHIDANAALFSKDERLYGYVQTKMEAHTDSGEAAVAFTQSVTIKLNDRYYFFPRVAEVSESGIINWNPKLSDLEPGEYKYKIFSTDSWGNAVSIYNLDEQNVCYGEMIITIGKDSHNQCEYVLDENKLAEKFGISANDIKTYAAQYGRLGTDWVTCAGTSTAPLVGMLLLVGMAGVGMFFTKKSR